MNARSLVIARAVAVIGGVGVLAAGATFAVGLSSTATLSDVSVNSVTAALNIWNGSSYQSSADGANNGFNITGLVPGTGKTANMYLQNNGGVNLAVTANVPTLPTSSGFSGWNNALVTITAERTGCTPPPSYVHNTATAPVSPVGTDNVLYTDMADLSSGQVILPCVMNVGDTGNGGVAGTPGNYDVHFDIAPASITGSSASFGPFTINLTGTQTP